MSWVQITHVQVNFRFNIDKKSPRSMWQRRSFVIHPLRFLLLVVAKNVVVVCCERSC